VSIQFSKIIKVVQSSRNLKSYLPHSQLPKSKVINNTNKSHITFRKHFHILNCQNLKG